MDAQYFLKYRESKFYRDPDVCRRYQGFPDRRPDQLEGWQQTFEVSVETATKEWNRKSADGALETRWGLTLLILMLFIGINWEKGQATEPVFLLITALGMFLIIWNRRSKYIDKPASATNIWAQRIIGVALLGSWVAWWNL